MSYTLGNITLPRPKSLTKRFVEQSKTNRTITNVEKRNVVNRLEVFELVFQNLTKSQADSILSEYTLDAVRTFTASDSNINIGPVDVLIDIDKRVYQNKDPFYRQDFKMTLREVR